MRIKILLLIPKLPILYRHRIMALIKEALRLSDEDYKNFLYPDKNSHISKIVKPFSFSLFLPKTRTAKKEEFYIDENFKIEDTVFYFPKDSFASLVVSSLDYQFIINLYNGLLELKNFDFGNGINIKILKVLMLNEKKINNDNVILKTNSPINIEDKNSKPILPFGDTTYFQKEFNIIHDKILKDIKGRGLNRELVFEPINLRKQVVKHTLKGFREKTGKPFMNFTCFDGVFKLTGDPEDLQILYQIGIGLRTGQGFGMVEIVWLKMSNTGCVMGKGFCIIALTLRKYEW